LEVLAARRKVSVLEAAVLRGRVGQLDPQGLDVGRGNVELVALFLDAALTLLVE